MSYQKSTEQTIMFKLVDETDYATPETGKSPSVEISKDAGTFTATTNSATEVSNGWYKVTLTSTEMNAEEIILKATAAGAAQSDRVFATESITALATDIAGVGFQTATQSLSQRPTGAGGGGTSCAWYDDDLRRANKFFKSFPTEFKDFEERFINLQKKVTDSESNSATMSQLSDLSDVIEAIQVTMDSMKANVNLSWTEKSIRQMLNNLTEIANLQYPIVVEVEDAPAIDVQDQPTGATAESGYTNDVTSLRQTTAGAAAIVYTGLLPNENRFSEWLDITVVCSDGDGTLQGKLYTVDGILIETYADLETNPVIEISNPNYKHSRERLVLQISASTETTSIAWSVTDIKWRYQYNG